MRQDQLVQISGEKKGRVYPLLGMLTIGRNPDSAILLEDLQVSRRHALIQQTEDGVSIRDLGSGNGTYINELRIKEQLLKPGDVLRVGSVSLRYETAGDVPSNVRFENAPASHVEAEPAADLYATFFRQSQEAGSEEQQRRAQQRLAAVYQANQIIASERNLHKLLARVMDQIFSLLAAHNRVIMLKGANDELVTEYVKSDTGEAIISSTIVNRAYLEQQAVITYDAADDSRFESGDSILAHNISSAMCVPLIHQDEVLGVLYVDARGHANAFTKNDLELLVALAAPAAIAIRNAQYTQQLQRAYHEYLIITANAIEMRDHYTIGHTWRVTNFAMEIARTLGWDEEDLHNCQMGGVLHDVGKIAVDDAILRKPGQLNEEETRKMRIHPERGARMLRDSEYLRPLIPYCLCHHERYDGKGYPQGLAGEKIPLEGRIIAAADTFDAMTSDRPYRQGLHPDVAIAEIVRGRGTQFDPAVVDALVQSYHEGRITRIIQESCKGHKSSIVCPFCSTYIAFPATAEAGAVFQCQVCKRHVRLQEKNKAYFGELMPEE